MQNAKQTAVTSEHQSGGRGGGRFFVFNAPLLQAGDILLSTVPNVLFSLAIRKRTASDFSHAAICTDPPNFIEAVSTGTRPFTILRIAVRDKQYVRVLRLRDTVPNSHTIAAGAGSHANSYLLAKYWWAGALASTITDVAAPDRRRVFCSQLVAEAYRKAGLDLAPGNASMRVTPEALAASGSLRDISDSVLQEVDGEVWPIDPAFVEGRITSENVRKEIQIRHKVADSMLAALKRKRPDLLTAGRLQAYGVESLEDSNDFHKYLACLVCADRDNRKVGAALDAKFTAALEKERYLSIPDLMSEQTLHLDEIIEYMLENGELPVPKMQNALAMYRQFMPVVADRNKEFETFAHSYEYCYRETHLRVFQLLAHTHKAMLFYGKELHQVLSRAIAILQSATPNP